MSDRVDAPSPDYGWKIASVADYTLLGNGYLLDANRRPVIYRGNLRPSPIRRAKRRQIFKYRLFSRFRSTQMDALTWVCRPNSSNYFHWLVETLPKLYFLDRIGWRQPIALSDYVAQKKWAKETLPLFPGLNFVAVPFYREIRAKTLFMIDEGDLSSWEERKKMQGRNAGMLKEMRDFLLASIKGEPADAHSRHIHISRQRDHRRKIANIEAVRPVLDKFCFEEIYLQDHSLGTQFSLMANAEVVFAPHGAGLANTIFMREGSKILEVKHIRKFQQDGVFPGLSRSMGVLHHVLKSERGGGRNDDFFVNPSQLESKLAELVGVHGALSVAP